MKVLFVCSGNNKDFDIIPFIKDQGDSLKSEGIEVDPGEWQSQRPATPHRSWARYAYGCQADRWPV
jgi:hypothetical protein